MEEGSYHLVGIKACATKLGQLPLPFDLHNVSWALGLVKLERLDKGNIRLGDHHDDKLRYIEVGLT